LIATVTSIKNNLLPDQEVHFEIVGAIVGSLSSDSALTNTDGEAKAVYSPPLYAEDMGNATTDVVHSGQYTIITVDDMVNPVTNSGVLLFQVFREDLVLGYPSSGQDAYYSEYIAEEGFEVNPSRTAADTQSGIDFEHFYRTSFGFPTLNTYDDTDTDTLGTGRKEVVTTIDPDAVHPHYGIEKSDVVAPIFPDSYSNVGTTESPIIRLVYDAELPLFSGYDFKSYFAVAESEVKVRAYFIHPRTNRRVYSNTITIEVTIPDKADGVFFFDDADEDISDGLFTKTINIDDLSDSYILSTSGEHWDTYLEDRISSGELRYKPLVVNRDTSVLYHFDGDYLDSGPSGIDGVGHGTTFISEQPYWEQSLQVSDSGHYVEASGIFGLLNMYNGSIEFAYKAPYAGYLLGSGGFSEFFTYVAGKDVYHATHGVFITATEAGGTPYVTFRYVVSGETAGAGVSDFGYRIDESDLNDGQWHLVRMGWTFETIDAHSGTCDLKAWIDNKQIIDGVGLVVDAVPLSVSSGILQYAVGFPNYSAVGYYDEFRLSSHSQSDADFQFNYYLTYEEYVDWFRRTKKMDSVILGLETWTFSGNDSGMVPVGFRIKDDNINIASLLDQRTFYDLNDPLPSGTYDV